MKSLSDIVDNIHKNEANGLTKEQINTATKSVVSAIAKALVEGDEVRINNFGSFSVSERGERMGRNPATGEAKLIPASNSVKFKAAKALKDLVSK